MRNIDCSETSPGRDSNSETKHASGRRTSISPGLVSNPKTSSIATQGARDLDSAIIHLASVARVVRAKNKAKVIPFPPIDARGRES